MFYRHYQPFIDKETEGPERLGNWRAHSRVRGGAFQTSSISSLEGWGEGKKRERGREGIVWQQTPKVGQCG